LGTGAGLVAASPAARATAAAAPHEIDWRWVRGHSGDVMNERADALATAARERLVRAG